MNVSSYLLCCQTSIQFGFLVVVFFVFQFVIVLLLVVWEHMYLAMPPSWPVVEVLSFLVKYKKFISCSLAGSDVQRPCWMNGFQLSPSQFLVNILPHSLFQVWTHLHFEFSPFPFKITCMGICGSICSPQVGWLRKNRASGEVVLCSWGRPWRSWKCEASVSLFPILAFCVAQSISLPSCSSQFICTQMWDRPVCKSPPCHESSLTGCQSLPLLPVWMNVSSLTPHLLDFHTVWFSVISGCFLFLNLLSFFWLCKEAQLVYLHLHLGPPSQIFIYHA